LSLSSQPPRFPPVLPECKVRLADPLFHTASPLVRAIGRRRWLTATSPSPRSHFPSAVLHGKMSANNPSKDFIKPSDPIAINTSARRGRSFSLSSGYSSSSDSSASELQTPSPTNSQRVTVPSPSSSPILSYFLGQSPTKTPGSASFPFRKFGPVEEEKEVPATVHARRASNVVAGRFAQPQTQPLPGTHVERGTALLRRLSLSSGAFVKPPNEGPMNHSVSPPSPPPNTAVSPTAKTMPFSRDSRPRRSATLMEPAKPRRAPSPMGERILKGHFDGFN
jgi:hypothetical protein